MKHNKSKNYFLSVMIACVLFLTSVYMPMLQAGQVSNTQPNYLKGTDLVIYGSSYGRKIFYQSEYANDFWPLSQYFIMQKNRTFCSIATAVMILNALKIKAPLNKVYAPYRIFTQDNIFTSSVRRKIEMNSLYKEGLTLDSFGILMRQFSVAIKIFHADNISVADFRKVAINALHHADMFIVVNIDRSLYGKKGGHFSPLAAYDQKTDRFLIMDVARYRYPPVWVKVKDLFKAMDTLDTSSHETRGFAVAAKSF